MSTFHTQKQLTSKHNINIHKSVLCSPPPIPQYRHIHTCTLTHTHTQILYIYICMQKDYIYNIIHACQRSCGSNRSLVDYGNNRNNPACTKSSRVTRVLKLDTIQKKNTERKKQPAQQTIEDRLLQYNILIIIIIITIAVFCVVSQWQGWTHCSS